MFARGFNALGSDGSAPLAPAPIASRASHIAVVGRGFFAQASLELLGVAKRSNAARKRCKGRSHSTKSDLTFNVGAGGGVNNIWTSSKSKS